MAEDTYKISVELDTTNVQNELLKLRRQTIQQIQSTVGPVTASMMTGMPIMTGIGTAPGISAASLIASTEMGIAPPGGFGIQFGPTAMDYAARAMLPFVSTPAADVLFGLGVNPRGLFGQFAQFSAAQRVAFNMRERLRRQLRTSFGQLTLREQAAWIGTQVLPWMGGIGSLINLAGIFGGVPEFPISPVSNLPLRLLQGNVGGVAGIAGSLIAWGGLMKLAGAAGIANLSAVAAGLALGGVAGTWLAKNVFFSTPSEWAWYQQFWTPSYYRKLRNMASRYGIGVAEMAGRIQAIEELYQDPNRLQRWASAASWLWNPQGRVPFGMDIEDVGELYANYVGYIKTNQYIGSSQLIRDALRNVNIEARFRSSVESTLAAQGIPLEERQRLISKMTRRPAAGGFLQRLFMTAEGIPINPNLYRYSPLFREYPWYERVGTRLGLFGARTIEFLTGGFEYITRGLINIGRHGAPTIQTQEALVYAKGFWSRAKAMWHEISAYFKGRAETQRTADRFKNAMNALESTLIERGPDLLQAMIRTGEVLPFESPATIGARMKALALQMADIYLQGVPKEALVREFTMIGTEMGIGPLTWARVRPTLQRFAPYGAGPQTVLPLLNTLITTGRQMGYLPPVLTARELNPLIEFNNAIMGRLLSSAYSSSKRYKEIFVNMGGPVRAGIYAFNIGRQMILQSPLGMVAAFAAEAGKAPSGGFTDVFDLFNAAGEIFDSGNILDILLKIKNAPKKAVMQYKRHFSVIKTMANAWADFLGIDKNNPREMKNMFEVMMGVPHNEVDMYYDLIYRTGGNFLVKIDKTKQAIENILSKSKVAKDSSQQMGESNRLTNADTQRKKLAKAYESTGALLVPGQKITEEALKTGIETEKEFRAGISGILTQFIPKLKETEKTEFAQSLEKLLILPEEDAITRVKELAEAEAKAQKIEGEDRQKFISAVISEFKAAKRKGLVLFGGKEPVPGIPQEEEKKKEEGKIDLSSTNETLSKINENLEAIRQLMSSYIFGGSTGLNF